MKSIVWALGVVLFLGCLGGCAISQAASEEESFPVAKPPAETRVTDRPGNIYGEVPILMYHRTGPEDAYMVRSKKSFINDLNRIYAMGFRPVTVHEYATNQMTLPRGASPIVLTFDDSDPSQFRLLEDGSIDPDCFVGIWNKFAEERGDFPVKATFFILPNGPFGQKAFAKQKIKMLSDWGCEIGSHTMTHSSLKSLSNEKVIEELGKSYDYVSQLGFRPRTIATPYGISPKKRSLLHNFQFHGKRYGYENICLAGWRTAPSPLSPTLNRTMIPRINTNEKYQGITYWLNRISNGQVKPYVQP